MMLLTRNDSKRLGVMVLLAALLLLAACAPRAAETASQTAETAEAVRGDLSANATAAGSLTARRSAALQAPTSARVAALHVRAGQDVTAGEPLVSLDTTGAALDVSAAQLDVRLAEAQLAGLLAAPTAAVAAAQASLDDLRAAHGDR